jgi:periplasmic protein TonB
LKRKDYGAAIFAAGLTVSLAVHVGFAASWLYTRSGELGSVDTATNAISVNLEATDVLDALESAAAKEAASSPAGALVTATASKTPEENEAEEEREETRQRAEEAARIQTEAEVEAEEKKMKEKKQQAAVAGGAGTAGLQEAEASAGRVSASQGSILNYGASLRAIISAHAPRDIRRRALRVSFNIAPAGGLTRVDVMQSSGDFAVDLKVIDLVRKLSAEFPPPPKGATSNQLSYNIEIIFR